MSRPLAGQLVSPIRFAARWQQYYDTNRETVADAVANYRDNQPLPTFKWGAIPSLANRLRSIVRNQIFSTYPGDNRPFVEELVGCPLGFLRIHIQNQFKPGMSWQNYGDAGWHLDHIHPVVFFRLVREDERHQCFHFSNLQPLWAVENLRKGAKTHKRYVFQRT